MRGLQIPEKKMHDRLHLRALFPTRGASKIRARAQNLRSQLLYQAPQRAPSSPERRCLKLSRLRSRDACQRPRLRLRRRHLFLQRQVQRLQKELDAANIDLLRYACNELPPPPANSLSMVPPPGLGIPPSALQIQQLPQRPRSTTMEYINGGGLYISASYNYSLPYTIPWADTASDGIDEELQQEEVAVEYSEIERN
ncbi:hypothetical protein K1719_016751 [Acacia pycnantha]|nr:hypothetical protein K1719_016751 [Acacia pycnantha]